MRSSDRNSYFEQTLELHASRNTFRSLWKPSEPIKMFLPFCNVLVKCVLKSILGEKTYKHKIRILSNFPIRINQYMSQKSWVGKHLQNCTYLKFVRSVYQGFSLRRSLQFIEGNMPNRENWGMWKSFVLKPRFWS